MTKSPKKGEKAYKAPKPTKAPKAKSLKKRDLVNMLVELFKEHPGKNYEIKTIFRELKLTTHPAKMLCMDVLEDMLDDEFIRQTNRTSFCLSAAQSQVLEGTFIRKANGRNSFKADGSEEPIFVAERNAMNAMNGDKVRVTLLARRQTHIKEAVVTEIIKRAREMFVGRLQVDKHYAFLLTESRMMSNDIFIPLDKLKGGQDGDKAVVRITQWPEENKNPVGEVIDVLGPQGENNTEMHAILAEFGLPYHYPEHVEKAAESIPETISEEEIARREDMREVTTFTIDPRDAKDFDDAISIRSKGEGLWEVGVHIADVSHYVTPGSVIDQEAYERATSVYLVDRTIPMLPERLCNLICSLRPDEEKLAYSVIFTLDDQANIKDYHIAHTVIRSNRRFTYEEVQAIFEKNGVASPEDLKHPSSEEEMARVAPPAHPGAPFGEYGTELLTLNRLAKMLRSRRFSNGAIDFDRFEIRFNIDEDGHPISTYFKFAKDANRLVEEYMLLANRTVAESIGKVGRGKKAKTLPYRVHDMPDPSKLQNLSEFITRFGYKIKANGSKDDVSRSLNRLLSEVRGTKEQNLIELVTLRTMMKARYSVHNIGHYGLAFDYYTHFTSPIRRYPDLMVHRLLTRYADGERSVNAEKCEEQCIHSSEMEQLAANAERASIKYKQVEFMADHLGEEYEGTISGVTEFGLYVEITENKCEGMIPLRDLGDDYYYFDEKNYCLVGRRHHHRYSLGDPVTIRVARANIERKLLDFALIGPEADSPLTTTEAVWQSINEKKKKSKKGKKKGV